MSPPVSDSSSPIQVLVCYSPDDVLLKDDLNKHLRQAINETEIVLTDIQRVMPGAELSMERVALLMSAPVIICLISVDYFQWMRDHEDVHTRLMERFHREEVHLIPVLLRPTLMDDALADLQMLPRNGVPVTKWKHQESAFFEISNELQKVIKGLLVDHAVRRACRKAGLPPATPAAEAETHAICQLISPFVAGRSVLWIDSHPEQIQSEVAMLQELRLQVSVVGECEPGHACLDGMEHQHLIITDWHGGAAQGGGDECIEFARAMQARGLGIPLIVYSPRVDAAETARRQDVIRGLCITGLTHCPRELFKWAVVELLRSRALDRKEFLIPPALLPSTSLEKAGNS